MPVLFICTSCCVKYSNIKYYLMGLWKGSVHLIRHCCMNNVCHVWGLYRIIIIIIVCHDIYYCCFIEFLQVKNELLFKYWDCYYRTWREHIGLYALYWLFDSDLICLVSVSISIIKFFSSQQLQFII